MFDLSGRVAVVTGAGQGVGVGIARALAGNGASVAVNDLVAERAGAVASELAATGATVVAAPFDVVDAAAVEAGISRVTASLGPVDILVNNAGVPEGMSVAPFRQLDAEEWRRYVDLNLYGSLNCVKAVIDGMCERGWGRVVQISSGAGHTGLRLGVSIYGASKGGIEGFMRHLSQEVARDGVTVNSLALGMMGRDGRETDETLAAMGRQVPVGRLGHPDDVGAAVVYLASAEAEWMTGQTIDLNGGATTS
jgi:3-oxoacyl-[acyl-carrier protein] reductase